MAKLTADTYWQSQPAAVRKLRDLPVEEVFVLAMQLAQQGFTIDVPIMVWGWDPVTTMLVRQNQGYTWVPAAHMAPVPVAPGLNFPGLPSYDPSNPPPGAIKVSVDAADYPRAADLTTEDYPFDVRWPFRRTATGDGFDVGVMYLATDALPIGTRTRDEKFEKVQDYGVGGPIALWVRVK